MILVTMFIKLFPLERLSDLAKFWFWDLAENVKKKHLP